VKPKTRRTVQPDRFCENVAGWLDCAALLIAGGHWPCKSARFKLRADLLDLRRLLFQACGKGFDFLLLLCNDRFLPFSIGFYLSDCGFLLLHFPVLFQELI